MKFNVFFINMVRFTSASGIHHIRPIEEVFLNQKSRMVFCLRLNYTATLIFNVLQVLQLLVHITTPSQISALNEIKGVTVIGLLFNKPRTRRAFEILQ